MSQVATGLLLLVSLNLCPAVGLGAEYRLFWGDVHGHSAVSDGKGSPGDYFTYARDVAKLDFVILTDHDFGNGPPWRMSPEVWNQIQDQADQYTVAGEFVAMAGYEWTSQAKYWTDVGPNRPSERLFPGPPKFYNHKNVYFPARVEHIFSAKDPAYCTPGLLAEAVRKQGGLIHNNHPFVFGDNETKDQWAYGPSDSAVIVNTEMGPDTNCYQGKIYQLNWEQTVREFLGRGGRTGFVGGTDTHEGKPAARTAVLAEALTRDAMLVLFHDDGLDRMTDALGPVGQYTYGELLSITFRPGYRAAPDTRIPTLAAVLALARQRAMLLHLDVKEAGLEEDIARLLDAADVWMDWWIGG